MEVSGAVSRQISGLYGRNTAQSMDVSGTDARRAPCSLSVSGRSLGTRDFGNVGRRIMDSSRFCDDGHLKYYVSPRCGGGRLKKEKEAVKKKLKLLKGLSGDLSAANESGFVLRFDDSLVGEFQMDRFSQVEETREALRRQLQNIIAEEKEQKRNRKLEKAKSKSARLQTLHESSSSSSESSDNEGKMNTRSYRIRKALSQPFPDQWQTDTLQTSTQIRNALLQTNTLQTSSLPLPMQTQQLNSDTRNVGVAQSAARAGRVEVCMGNKCKKAGAAALMEEFEKVMGDDGVVCGCKCMGKCRDGPNVRVLDIETRSANPLCIGVGMEDVGRIVADYLGHKQSGFAAAV